MHAHDPPAGWTDMDSPRGAADDLSAQASSHPPTSSDPHRRTGRARRVPVPGRDGGQSRSIAVNEPSSRRSATWAWTGVIYSESC